MPSQQQPQLDQSQDAELQRLMDKLRQQSLETNNPMGRSIVLDLEFDNTDTTKPLIQKLKHGLGRVPEGWTLMEIQPKTIEARVHAWSTHTAENLYLLATANCFAKVLVY